MRQAMNGRGTVRSAADAPGSQRIRNALDARARATRPRSRLTARFAILVLVLAALTISFASSLRAYVAQRDHLQELKAGNEALRQENAAMDEEIARWNDSAYVKAQAREQLGYMFPGDRGFKTLGADGKPLQKNSTLPEAPAPEPKAKTPWWTDAWTSVELAGNPPKPTPTYDPNTTINGDDADVAKGNTPQ